MSEHLARHDVRRYLAAFADGELDVERNLQVMEQLAMDPQHTNRVVHQQQLRAAVRRAMAEPGEAPARLREEVEALAGSETGAGDEAGPVEATPSLHAEPTPTAPAPRRGPIPFPRTTRQKRRAMWSAALAAAAMVAAAMIVLPMIRGGSPSHADGLLSAATLYQFHQRHMRCAEAGAPLMNTAAYPRDLGRLPAALRRRLDHAPPAAATLNLASIGYQFARAGDCIAPGPDATHMIYYAREGGPYARPLSLWLRAATGRLNIEPGRLYDATGPESTHTILLWKHEGLNYYLVGSKPDRLRQAARLIRSRTGAK